MKPLSDCKLYAFVDAAYLRGRRPGDLARALCDGGADIIQLRAKDFPLEDIRRMGEAIAPICAAAGVPLVINDYPEIAANLGADFCHLGQGDFFGQGHTHTAALRKRYPEMRLGLSTHSHAEAERALQAEPDYIAIGPVYPTATKPEAEPVTLDYVRWAAANGRVPWFAIGGINLQNLDHVLAAGARRICVVSAILSAPDIAFACRAFKNRL